MNEETLTSSAGQGTSGYQAQDCVRQVASLCEQFISPAVIDANGLSFVCSSNPPDKREGLVSAKGEVQDDGVLAIKLELVRAAKAVRVFPSMLFAHLAKLGERVRVIEPVSNGKDEVSLWVEMRVLAIPMSFSRTNGFVSELKNLETLAKLMQAELPQLPGVHELRKRYQQVSDIVEPVVPWGDGLFEFPKVQMWTASILELMTGMHSLAMPFPFPVLESFWLSSLAHQALQVNSTIGRLVLPSINGKALLETARKAPGPFAVPAVRLSLGTNAYELANEVQAMIASLSSNNVTLIFTGTSEQLRAVFHGGQGGMSDPLSPIVCSIPEIPIEVLTRFAVHSSAVPSGGINAISLQRLTEQTLLALKPYSFNEQQRIVATVANHAVSGWIKGSSAGSATSEFAGKVSGISETLSGLSSKPRASRTPAVQERYTKVLAEGDLSSFLKEHLLAQDRALDQLAAHLRMEVLTRPMHQPIRYCAQGTPATGKSESAVLLAGKLDVPYINVDAASIPDYYSAAAQLLGSGRGIVGSYQSGRLEQAAKHHTGAVIEISDLDHANERVRSGLADLFLQVLETGEAQSAAGSMFSCANLIFAFTMNLPDGMDEDLRKEFGFGKGPSERVLRSHVMSEIKKMLSGAFLSRAGTPILFAPLTGPAIEIILERAIRTAVVAAADRLHLNVTKVEVKEGTGAVVRDHMDVNLCAFGARSLLEFGRSLAAQALMDLINLRGAGTVGTLYVQSGVDGKLFIDTRQENAS